MTAFESFDQPGAFGVIPDGPRGIRTTADGLAAQDRGIARQNVSHDYVLETKGDADWLFAPYASSTMRSAVKPTSAEQAGTCFVPQQFATSASWAAYIGNEQCS
jgi:hypothetical protein